MLQVIQAKFQALTDLAAPSTKDVLPKLVTKTTWSVLDKSERKTSRPGPVTAGKGFTLSISNEDMGDIIKIIKPLENLKPDGVSERVKHDIK